MRNHEPERWYADPAIFTTGLVAVGLSVVAGAVAANNIADHVPADSSWAVIARTVALIAWLAVFTAFACHAVKARSHVIRAGQDDLADKLDTLERKVDALATVLKDHDGRVVPIVDLVDLLHDALTQLPGAVQVWGDSRLTDGILQAMERARATNGSRPQLRSVDN